MLTPLLYEGILWGHHYVEILQKILHCFINFIDNINTVYILKKHFIATLTISTITVYLDFKSTSVQRVKA